MTTERTGRSKSDLLQALRSSGQTVVERLRALPAERFEEGRYENGWNGRQILGHIASMEWTYPRLIDVARQAASPRGSAKRAGSAAPATRGFRSSNDDYNRRQVAKRADASIEEILAEFITVQRVLGHAGHSQRELDGHPLVGLICDN